MVPSPGPGLDDALKLTAVRLVLPEDVRLPFPGPTAIGASWFLLRGIEVSNVRCQDVKFSRDPRHVTLQLPVSKTDPEAKGCARTHCCICYKSREPLCVYHALLDIVMALQKGQAFRPEAYLFRTEGRMPTARQVTALAKCCAITLGQESLDDWHAGALDRWAQHSFRVAGAQFLARCGIDVAVFPIVQGDKVRRGDDWLRSGHNSTVWASDTPPYMGASTIIAAVRYCAHESVPHLAAVDHEGAYRALPVRDPAECCTVLPGDSEGSVWQHNVLPFGATSSVWAYLRVADAICFLSIVLLFLAAAHFLDDFFMIEGLEIAPAGFRSFQDIHAALGFRMKKAKEKPPAARQTLLGVDWSVNRGHIHASAGTDRVQKIQQMISDTLTSGEMSQQAASKLAGKLNFATSWVFGQVGKALLKPLYSRQKGLPGSSVLSKQLRVALQEIQGVLPVLKPVQLPLQLNSQAVSI